MERETGLGVGTTGSASGQSRRRFVSGVALVAAGVAAAAMGAADARKRKKKPSTTTITRTYTNDGQIRVPAVANTAGAANPYPASITVADLSGGTVRNVTVTVKGISHSTGSEVAIMLAKDTTNAILMGAAGGLEPIDDATVTFDDNAVSALPNSSSIVSGRFQPTNYYPASVFPNLFKAPAPLASGNSLLSAFRGVDPDGSWRLYVTDPVILIDGAISGGWELTITADVPAKRKKRKKKR